MPETVATLKAAPMPTEPKKSIHVGRRAKRLREQVNNSWRINVQADTRPEDYCHRDALGAAADGLAPYDRVEMIPADERWFAECLVLAAGLGWAKLKIMQVVELPPREEVVEGRIPDTHKIVPAPPAQGGGFLILRKADGKLMKNEGGAPFQSAEAAIRFLLDHASMRGERER